VNSYNTKKKDQETFILCLIIDTLEKAGIIYNELRNLRFAVSFFLRSNKPLGGSKSVRERDYKRLFEIIDYAQTCLQKNLCNLKDSYREYLREHSQKQHPLKQHQKNFISLIALRACVQRKLNDIIQECRYLSQKLLQIKESSPKYIPIPVFVKRYTNSAIVEFFTRYANEILLNKFLRPLFSDNTNPELSLYWEFRQSDAIFFKEIYKNGLYKNHLFLNTSYWFQELPVYIPFIAHEIGHWLLGTRLTNSVLKDPLFQLEKRIRDFLSQIPYVHVAERTVAEELICDAIGILCFREAYIFALFLHSFGHEYADFIDEDPKEMQDVCSLCTYVGDYLSLNPLSSWIRLNVLCNCYTDYVKTKNKEGNSMIRGIMGNLEKVHEAMKESYPPHFRYIAENVSHFEKEFSRFCIDQLSDTFYNHKALVNKIQEVTRRVCEWEKEEKAIIDVFSLHFNHITNEYIRHLTKNDASIGIDLSSALNVLTTSRFGIANKLIESLYEKDGMLDEISKRPPPFGRYFRHIANAYPFENVPKECISKSLNKILHKYDFKIWEMAFCKVRFDCRFESNPQVTFLDFSTIQKSLSKFVESSDRNEKSFSKRKNAFLVISGIYTFILFQEGFSTKSLPSRDDKEWWPPKLDFPYYTVIHSLIELEPRLKEESLESSADPFSVLVQVKLQNRPEHLASFLKTVLSEKNNWKRKQPRIFTSIGWEDVLVLVEHIPLEEVFKIKAKLFEKHPNLVKRTETTILLHSKFNPEEVPKEGEVLGDVTIYSAVRLKTSDEKASIINFCKHCGNLERNYGFRVTDIVPGRFDVMLDWNQPGQSTRKFLKNWSRLLNHEDFLKDITDVQTTISITKEGFSKLMSK